ncbi:MAG TPA: DUF4956 domain-containing protein [Candidatus Hydrogenedentes bacterium]|nr:DUF4956 domain-containing protein [Candidatus Hydrogenedentota bacterium]HIJ73098.1 DUF4956 domain-containing protein [Candidatus Hydrogenedentota bacterium]
MELLGRLAGSGLGGPTALSLEDAALALVLAFVLGQLAAWTYVYTHTGLSYSRTFVQSIVLLTLIIALGMMVIGTSLVIAFGLIGALAVIRFRNILKDTRDTAFVFWALVTGMASGTQKYGLAITGTVLLCGIVLYLHWTSFGSRHSSDGFVRFRVREGEGGLGALHAVLKRHCRSSQLMSQRFHQTGATEMAYRLTMRDPLRAENLVAELQRMEGVSNVTFVLHEEQTEV